MESGDAAGALKDVNRAISLNNQYAPAYSLRAKLRMEEIAEQQAEDEEEEMIEKIKKQKKGDTISEEKAKVDGSATGSSEAEKVHALQDAAEDALLGMYI